MIGMVRKTLSFLTPKERRRGGVVLGMMLGLAVLETAGVASIMPFLAVLGNPGMVESNAALAWLYEAGRFESLDTFLIALGVGAFIMVVTSAVFRAVTTYAMHRFTEMRRYTIGARLLESYLRQPYPFFLNRNSADLSKSLLSEVGILTTSVIRPGMNLLAHGLTAVMVVIFLIVVDPVLALVVTLVLGGIYGGIYLLVRGYLVRIGHERVGANRQLFTAATEAFGGIKDLKVMGREESYVGRFRGPAARYSRHQATSSTLSAVPKYAIEAVGFGGVLILAITLMSVREDLGAVLPLLGLYAFAGYRLLPAAQQVYAGFSALRFGLPAVEEIHKDLSQRPVSKREEAPSVPLPIQDGIRFEDVTFRYPGADEPALRNVSLDIRAHSLVGIVGKTGAGKTTVVDLILGLLHPTDGRMLVDGEVLGPENIRRWQRTIGYVPQTIYLSDASVAENIAFGLETSEIDVAAVEAAARVASIHDFIVNELPGGYATEVGERGIRLSGGQRQRIGIARALYSDPKLLVLDEATSALDTGTERAIMESVERLSGQKTIIMIAHRMSTVEQCDQIIVLEGGRLSGVGRFEELQASNAAFRAVGGGVR